MRVEIFPAPVWKPKESECVLIRHTEGETTEYHEHLKAVLTVEEAKEVRDKLIELLKDK